MLNPPMINRLQGKTSPWMGAPPPVAGKSPTAGTSVVVGEVVPTVAVVDVSGVSVGEEAVQIGPLIELESNVTLPPIAKALPSKLTPVPKTIPVPAMIVPTKEPLTRFAWVGTYQNTSQAVAPLIKLIDPALVRLLDALKIKTPSPSRVRTPPPRDPAPKS